MNIKKRAMLKILTILILIVVLLKICLVFLWPFIISIILVLILEPFVKLFRKLKFSRRLSVIFGFVLMLLIFVLFFYFIGNYVYNQVGVFVNTIPDILSFLSNKFKFLNFQDINFSSIINTLESILPAYKEKIIGTVVETVNGLIYILVVFITTIFISIDLDKIFIIMKRYIPYNYFCIIYNVVKYNISIMYTQFKLVLFTTIETVIGLYLLGIPNSLTISLICGILDIIPVVGTIIIFFPMAVLELSKGNVFTAIGLILLYILLAVLRKIMEVKMMGSNLHIHPAVAILSLYIGIILYGAWGVIIGPFIITLIREIFNVFFTKEGMIK